MVRIHPTWGEAAEHAGVATRCRPEALDELGGFPAFEAFQAGDLHAAPFLAALAAHLGLASRADAEAVHHAILDEAYPGTEALVQELHAAGIATGCLSNTNALHWRRMAHSGEFPGIEALDHKFASHELQLQKPEPAIFRAVERATGRHPASIVFFDDGLHNVAGALACGWRAHTIDPQGNPASQVRRQLAAEGILSQETSG